jgi:hypothetical protein
MYPISPSVPGTNHYYQSSSTIITDTIVAATVSTAAWICADMYRWQAPQFSATLRVVPIIATVLWIIRRLDFNASHFPSVTSSSFYPHSQPSYVRRTWNWISTPLQGMYSLPARRFPSVNVTPANSQIFGNVYTPSPVSPPSYGMKPLPRGSFPSVSPTSSITHFSSHPPTPYPSHPSSGGMHSLPQRRI